MRAILFGALASLVLLGSCETMSADECAGADWGLIGMQDGQAGATMDKFAGREKSCTKKGFTADMAAYRRGRDEGLKTFCQPESGWRAGLSGYSYASICPPGLEAGFLDGYRDGSFAYKAKQAVTSAESAVSSARSEVDRIDDKIAAFEKQAYDSSKTQAERDDARKRIGELRRDRDRARDRVRDAERAVYQAQSGLDRAHYDLGGRWGPW